MFSLDVKIPVLLTTYLRCQERNYGGYIEVDMLIYMDNASFAVPFCCIAGVIISALIGLPVPVGFTDLPITER
jgi:hypothetical protein